MLFAFFSAGYVLIHKKLPVPTHGENNVVILCPLITITHLRKRVDKPYSKAKKENMERDELMKSLSVKETTVFNGECKNVVTYYILLDRII